MKLKAGRRDVWDERGNLVAEVVGADWKKLAPLLAAAPELKVALAGMVEAYQSARCTDVATRIANDRKLERAVAILRRLDELEQV